MFLRNAWYVAATRAEIGDKLLARTIMNEPVVLYRDREGVACALEDRCCHRGAPLSLGWVSEQGLVCGYHGLTYDASGRCVAIPGHTGKITDRARVRSYPLVEKADYVWIWMGDADRADAGLIVDYPPDDPVNWPRTNNMLHVKGSYVMVLENLMDLSHLAYLHRNSIGSSPEDTATARMETQHTPTGVKFLRLMLDVNTPPLFKKMIGLPDRCDRWSEFEFVNPSCILQYTGFVPAGSYAAGVREGGALGRTLHAVTPETERSCFYFFNRADGFAKYAPPDYRGLPVADVFAEDAFMIEQQQSRLEGFDTSRLINIESDVARVQMVRFLEQSIRAEAAAMRQVAE